MATEIDLVNPATGLSARGYYGFSWTSLFFGPFPALFRGDLVTFLILFTVILGTTILSGGLGEIIVLLVWPFYFNRYYTRALISKGYAIVGPPDRLAEARATLGVIA